MENKSLDLFLLMFNLSQIQNTDDVVRIYAEALNAIYPELNVRYAAAACGEDYCIPLVTVNGEYGSLLVSTVFEAFPAVDQAMIRNSVGLLSVILENRDFSKLLNERAAVLERDLQRSEKIIENLGEMIPDIIYIIDLMTGKIVYVNKAVENTLGVTCDEVLKNGFAGVFAYAHDDELELIRTHNEKLKNLKQDSVIEIEYRLKDTKGGWHWFISRETPCQVDAGGYAGRILGCATDITSLKTSESRFKAMNEEKSVLLREVHHRVKNNLAVISSLLSLQEQMSTDAAVKNALVEGRNRIQVMALVHEELYRNDNFAHIGVREYFLRLIQRLESAFFSDVHEKSRIRAEIESHSLEISKLVPVALILNELLTNAIKYGCSDAECIEVDFRLDKKEPLFSLLVADRGPGLPAGISLENPQSLGLQIVNSLAQQIDAQLRVEDGGGCRIRLMFRGE